jgi:hypothetical protein
VIRQEHPSSGPPSTPQQRPWKPSPRKQSTGDWGIAIPAFLIIGLGWLVLCWPAIFAHGYTETGGWRWDIHSTYACAAWWGTIGFVALMTWAGRRVPADRVPKAVTPPAASELLPPPSAALAPPKGACRHLHAIPVESALPELPPPAWLCPQCDEQLPTDFGKAARPCCGTRPGNPHWYSCPEAKVTP